MFSRALRINICILFIYKYISIYLLKKKTLALSLEIKKSLSNRASKRRN